MNAIDSGGHFFVSYLKPREVYSGLAARLVASAANFQAQCDTRQACPRCHYCKMELFQRQSKVGEITDKTGKPELKKVRRRGELIRRPRERFCAAWRRVMLSLNVFFCSCLNLGYLVSDLL